jgi:hypothetical protein
MHLHHNDDVGKIYYIREFKKQLIRFLDELIEQFPSEGDFVLMRIFVKDQIPTADVIGRFIRDVLPVKDMIDGRDEKFFLDNYLLTLSDQLDHGKMNYLRDIWQSDMLTNEDKQVMWKWADVFIHIAEMYFKKYGHVPGWEP